MNEKGISILKDRANELENMIALEKNHIKMRLEEIETSQSKINWWDIEFVELNNLIMRLKKESE